MLIQFKVENFKSIREEQLFSLSATSLAGNDQCLIYPELPGMNNIKILKGAAIFGANASGKSTLLNAIRFLTRFVQQSATKFHSGDIIPVSPYKLDKEHAEQASKFEITFVADNVRYTYGVSVNTTRVVNEYLVAYPKGLPQHWYRRTYDSKTKSYNWTNSSATFKSDKTLQEKTRENALFLSVAAQFNHQKLTPLYKWFRKSLRFINLDAFSGLTPTFTTELMGKDSSYRNQVIKLLQTADIGITDVRIKKKKISQDDLKLNLPPSLIASLEKAGSIDEINNFEVDIGHESINGDPIWLNLRSDESAGTQRYFALVGPWIDILEKGFTVFIDEIDTSLHPLLVKELLSLVFSAENNTKGAQIVFTTHNAMLLDQSLMRRDQIWFTEKTHEGVTKLYPLTDFAPRKDEALAKGYLAGRYGAIPYIPEGLNF